MTEAEVLENVRVLLKGDADEEYRKFVAKTVPNVPIEKIIGVRSAKIQETARCIDWDMELIFRAALPHKYHDENMLHAALLSEFSQEDDYQNCIDGIDRFLPYVDNWAVCDAISPKVFGRHPKGLEEKINDWLRAERPYTIRFGLLMLMKFYLDDFFDEEHFQWVIDISSNAQYVRMAQAWYFATALVKRWDQMVPLLENEMLEPTVHNLTIQKAVESRRITYDRKKYLRSLKLSTK